ncbi:TonB-dependent receptor [Erythrobacter sp. AP23]|uniref:TonB-dependent receptor n=1 Tax=Erythrobacter sp. AP23 TaxID=499656 RepID=UPI000B0D8EE3|nr:TonB-dependent receptor [Erythrobacter sp. AP23]
MIHRNCGRSGLKLALLATASTAIVVASPAFGQTAAPASTNEGTAEPADEMPVTEIIVTGSRVARTGFNAPTPTTVLGTDEFEKVAAPNLADVVNQIPAVRPSLTPSSSTNNSQYAGGNFLDLRGLGFNRTLVLVDGKRFVSTQIQGPVDINAIPQALIGSIDIVTGGASAAWGSDAVAGVINFKFDHGLEGFKGNVQAGITDHNDHRNYLASIAYGKSFADGRGRILLAGEIAQNSGIARQGDRDWGAQDWGIIANPAYTPTNDEPRSLLVRDARSANLSYGGVINSGPLAGNQFAPDGSLIPFRYGDLRTATGMVGGDGASGRDDLVLEVPLKRRSAYGRLSYELSNAITGYVEASWAKSKTDHPGLTRTDNAITIQIDNPFLVQSVRDAMESDDITSFTMGRYNRDYGRGMNHIRAETNRFVVGFEGDLGDGWNWDAYYTYGQTKNRHRGSNARITRNYNFAVDAVLDPTTGAAVCRDTGARGEGCVPINLFGDGAPSPQAIDYVTGETWRLWDITQNAAAATLRGQPFSTWAGPVSFATGLEWRRETADVTSDALSAAGSFTTGNTVPWDGAVNVTEIFGELVIPLAADQSWADALDLNVAGRITDYSTSGTVETWKVGATWDVNDDVRFRFTRSRDIRAPSLAELFSGATTAQFSPFDPVINESYSVQTQSRGNAGLDPEKADTLTAGVVLSPTFVPNLRLSVDYYNIKLEDAILALSAAAIVDRCYRDQPQLCGLITRGPDNRISQVESSPQNLQSVHTRGVDFELAYRTSVGRGDLSLRGLVTYVDKMTMDDGQTVTELAGSTDQPTIASIGGQPHWRFNLNTAYEAGPSTVSLTARYVGGGNIDNTYTSKDLDVLEHEGRLYFDLSTAYDIIENGDRNVTLFAAVRNLLDQDPPITGTGGFATVRSLYDVVGRTYTAGIRFRF